MLSLNGRGFAFIFATYDICRLTSDFENLKKLMAKSDSQELKAALKQAELDRMAAEADRIAAEEYKINADEDKKVNEAKMTHVVFKHL